jgi:hypothetical protein
MSGSSREIAQAGEGARGAAENAEEETVGEPRSVTGGGQGCGTKLVSCWIQ